MQANLKLWRWNRGSSVIILVLALGLAAAACDSQESNDDAVATTPTVAVTTTTSGRPDSEPVTLVGESLTVVAPPGWTAEEHEDGAGVYLRSPSATLNITLIPTAFFDGMFLELPQDATAETIADLVAPVLVPIEGVEQSPPEIVELTPDRSVVIVATHAADLDGEVVFMPAGPGMVAVATLTAERGAVEDARVASRLVVTAMEITTNADDLLAALTAPSSG